MCLIEYYIITANLQKKAVTHNAGANLLYSPDTMLDSKYSPHMRLVTNSNSSLVLTTNKAVKGNFNSTLFLNELCYKIISQQVSIMLRMGATTS